MTDLFDIEREAQRLERRLAMGVSPEVQLLAGLEFFRLLRDNLQLRNPDPYLMQFLPRLAKAATNADPEGFFPDEAAALADFAEWIKQTDGDAHAGALDVIAQLAKTSRQFLRECLSASLSDDSDENGRAIRPGGLASHSRTSIERGSPGGSPSRETQTQGKDNHDTPVTLNCLFVEHFPDLDLPPRGRLLKLKVTAATISKMADADDIVVRNPVTKPDDRFLAQARDSVQAARSYMHRRYGLSQAKRFRFDFAVASSGARFTGDSLGVAFAAGAIAALGKLEVLRERLAISPDVAFSGALSANGNLSPVDGAALKRKIDRAFFSRLKYLVIPRENITEAWTYLSELESRHPGRKLELVGADALDAVAGDPRLVPGERLSSFGYAVRTIWKAKRAPAVEVSVLLAVICFLLYLVLPAWYMPWFDRNPAFAVLNQTDNSLEARNRDSVLIWSEPFQCKLSAGAWSQLVRVHDLNGDGVNEVLFMPMTTEASPQRDWLYCFASDKRSVFKPFGTDHSLLFKRYCAIRGQYPGDTAGVYYDPEHLNVVNVAGKPVIITEVAQISPSRSHIRLWDPNGNPLGWFINAGGSIFAMAKDLDADGREELLFLNYNIRMGCTALLVLDLDSIIAGASPPYEDSVWDLSRVRRGNQAGYVLFPVTDLGREDLANSYNEPGIRMVREDTWGQLNVYVQESSHDGAVCVIYSLDRALRVVSVNFTDQFRKRRDDLVREGKLASVDWGQYADHTRDSVLHWRSGAWVAEWQLHVQSVW